MMGDAAVALRARFGSAASPSYRAAALTTAVLANNVPDFDFLYVGITGGRLGYLLHHRGHTHTLAAAPLLALLGVALVAFGFRLAKRVLTRRDLAHLGLCAVLGCVLHVFMDFGNNYGVHPFWPLYDGWLYGDAIFIIDPWLIIVLVGMGVGVGASRPLRGALVLAALALLALAWAVQLTSVGLASALTVFASTWIAGLWRASFRTRWLAGGAALGTLLLVLLGTRYVARTNVSEGLARDGTPSLALVDLVSTPSPGNPLCWSLLAVQRSASEYVVRQALASGWPALSSALACRSMNEGQTAPVVPSSVRDEDSDRVVWGPEFRAPLAQLERIHRESCVARAFSRFARVPFWTRRDARTSVLGDLRFDRSSALEFAELLLTPDAPCPRFEPPWLPPLSDLR
jgi:inner membrane protein